MKQAIPIALIVLVASQVSISCGSGKESGSSDEAAELSHLDGLGSGLVIALSSIDPWFWDARVTSAIEYTLAGTDYLGQPSHEVRVLIQRAGSPSVR
jgi:hypothetical protein